MNSVCSCSAGQAPSQSAPSLTRAGELLLRPLRETLGERSPLASVQRSQLVISSLGI